MITVQSLSKTYDGQPRFTAVDQISFSVEKNELFGLIGPDGAGKTSLFRVMATLLLPDEGAVSIDGMDVVRDYRAIRSILGYMPGRFSLYQDLTVEENLRFFATLFQTTPEEQMGLIGEIYSQLARFKGRRAGKLSGGMKQKLALCCALVHRPRVLLLDEPTTGVDPVSRREFWDILTGLRTQGITIVVSTPYMDEAIRCDRIGLIQKGRLLQVDRPADIVGSFPDDLYEVKAPDMHRLLREIYAYGAKTAGYAFGEYAHLCFPRGTTSAASIKSYFNEKGLATEVRDAKPTIEDCFIHLLKDKP